MFFALCLFSIALLVISMFVKDKEMERVPNRTVQANAKKSGFGKAFFILLAAQLVVVTINSMASLGRSLSMNSLGFLATAMTSTVVIAGLVSLPFPFVIGWLSDKLGRRQVMVVCYLGYALCMVMLAVSKSLWHFWVVVIFVKVGMVSMNVGAAFVTDIVDPQALGRGVSLFQTMGWIALALGCAVAGNVFQNFGISTTSFFSAALPVIGIILIVSIRAARAKKHESLAHELVLD